MIDNALRFSPAGAAIRITAAYHGDRATLEVADHGPGVPQDERDLIFERFQRGTRTGGEGGFGLGLAIGRELARRLDGELALVSQTTADGALRADAADRDAAGSEGEGDAGDEDAAGDAPAEAPSMPRVE